ncbi:MAG: ABC transporter substrate-binding protein, partial [Thermoleophilaceae bacterium]
GAQPAPASPATQAATATPAAAAKPIKLGALLPLTGPSAATGQDMREGYELAREQINAAGGIKGAPVEVIYEDDKNDPATAVGSFEKLVNNEKVEVMMGGLASTITAALIEPAKKAAVPMAWTGAAATSVEKGFEGQEWFFHYHPWEYQNAASALAFLKSTPYKRWAIAHEDGLFGTGGAKGFKDALPQQGQEVVATEAFKSGTTDFTAMLNRLKASGADGFVVIPFAGDMIPMLTQMREVGWQPKITYASPPSFPPKFGESPVAEGVAGLTLWTTDIPAPASKKFVADFQKKYSKLPLSYWSALAYTNLVTVADALRKSGPGNKAAWIKAMEETSYESPIGPTLKFTPSQTIKHQGFTSLVSFQWQAGKQQIVFPADLATAKLK